MLKFLQERVNKTTKELDQADAAARSEALLQQLAERQARVRDLTRKLAAKLDKDSQSEAGR